MPSYSFCLLGAGGTTFDYVVTTCSTDQAARERAASLLPGTRGVEIWRAKHLVGQVMPAAEVHAAAVDGVVGWFDQPSLPAAAA